MAEVVLVHGGWLGGWLWQRVLPLLCREGHQVHAPSLTGLGDRRHLLSADITPDLHATDIVNVMRWNELEDVVLVGHSYQSTKVIRHHQNIARTIVLLTF